MCSSFLSIFCFLSISIFLRVKRMEGLWRGCQIFPPFLRRSSLFSQPDYRRDQATRIRDVDTLSGENCQMFTPAAVAQLQRWTGHVRLAISVYRAARGNREDLALIVKGQKGTVDARAPTNPEREPTARDPFQKRFVYVNFVVSFRQRRNEREFQDEVDESTSIRMIGEISRLFPSACSRNHRATDMGFN